MSMKTNRGYDDTKSLLMMATGLADGTYSSVHHAARAVLSEPGGPNVDRLRRKFRELQRANGFDEISRSDPDFDPSDWWKLRISDFPIIAKMTAQNVIAFVRHPANVFRKALKASTPASLAFLLMGLVLFSVPNAALAIEIIRGLPADALAPSLLSIIFAAVCINTSTVIADEDAVLLAGE
jgi:hypothetical protein